MRGQPLEKDVVAKIRGLQFLAQVLFGAKATSASGECQLVIAPDKVLLTNEGGKVIAEGPAKVARVLARKPR